MIDINMEIAVTIKGGCCFLVGFMGVLEMISSPWQLGGPFGVYYKYKYPVQYCWNS
jgi:hypothetical protein